MFLWDNTTLFFRFTFAIDFYTFKIFHCHETFKYYILLNFNFYILWNWNFISFFEISSFQIHCSTQSVTTDYCYGTYFKWTLSYKFSISWRIMHHHHRSAASEYHRDGCGFCFHQWKFLFLVHLRALKTKLRATLSEKNIVKIG